MSNITCCSAGVAHLWQTTQASKSAALNLAYAWHAPEQSSHSKSLTIFSSLSVVCSPNSLTARWLPGSVVMQLKSAEKDERHTASEKAAARWSTTCIRERKRLDQLCINRGTERLYPLHTM